MGKKFQVITPPTNAHLYTVRIRFKPDRTWQEALSAGTTSKSFGSDILSVGDQYSLTGTQEIEEDLILLNYFGGVDGGSFREAIIWAKSRSLEKTVPQEVFAIGEQYPNYHQVIMQNPFVILTTKECIFNGARCICDLWWNCERREAGVYSNKGIRGYNKLYAFRKPVRKT